MPSIGAPSDIREEDFDEKDRKLVQKLSSAISPFHRDVYRVLSKGLDFANMDRQLAEGVQVRTDASGNVVNSPSIKLTTKGRVKGTNVIMAENQTNTSVYPTSTPFISYSLKEGLLTILNVTGLQANSQYVLNVEIIT